jgi:hypothetical protein
MKNSKEIIFLLYLAMMIRFSWWLTCKMIPII